MNLRTKSIQIKSILRRVTSSPLLLTRKDRRYKRISRLLLLSAECY